MAKNVVCLGWGSLIWRLDGIPVDGWRPDGPCVRVEFVRQSSDGHLTLVLHDAVDPVPSLWAKMKVESLDEAVNALAKREGRPGRPLSNPDRDIGRWPRDNGDPSIVNLASWASSRGIDHVIWTALRPRYKDTNGRWPTKEEAVEYLSELSGTTRDLAEEYVRYAPQQIHTAYREHIVWHLGWKPALADCQRTSQLSTSDGTGPTTDDLPSRP